MANNAVTSSYLTPAVSDRVFMPMSTSVETTTTSRRPTTTSTTTTTTLMTSASVQHNDSVLSRLGNRFRHINREKKAAKTVGIIVGCFICCWAPFFSWYLFEAFCEACTPKPVIDAFFWLGYVNSAINPCIYALFSKDFRFAFKNLLCCRCERRKPAFRERRQSRFRSFWNSLRVQISSRSSDEGQTQVD